MNSVIWNLEFIWYLVLRIWNLRRVMSLLDDFLYLFYPRVCYACGSGLLTNEDIICTSCLLHLPRTNFHHDPDNPVVRAFWGRIPVHSATAYYYFTKKGKVQHLLHQLKYKGRKEIGIFIGRQFGYELRNTELFNTTSVIMPVPLHPSKLRKRGYNQSEQFALGLSSAMNVGLDLTTLARTKASESQTRKSRFKRWENVKDIFTVNHDGRLTGKHILLVDDVITTGATLEACAEAIFTIPGVKLSIVTIAFALR
jgi:ComF family protein